MSLTAIQTYVAELIVGIGNPGLEVWTDPPTGQADAITPQAFMIDAEGEGVRQTMGGVYGYYTQDHSIYIMVKWAIGSEYAARNNAFTALIDLIMDTIRISYTGVIEIPDPATNRTTQLLALGQTIKWRIMPPAVVDAEDVLLYTAQLIVDAREKVQYMDDNAGQVVAM